MLITDRWVVERRGRKAPLDPERPYGAFWEEECDASGARVSTAVVLLTNRECPFRCVMCDLWTHTLDEPVPAGAIVRQIRHASDVGAALRDAEHAAATGIGAAGRDPHLPRVTCTECFSARSTAHS